MTSSLQPCFVGSHVQGALYYLLGRFGQQCEPWAIQMVERFVSPRDHSLQRSLRHTPRLLEWMSTWNPCLCCPSGLLVGCSYVVLDVTGEELHVVVHQRRV